jgi:hypothetical protein
VKQLSAWDDHLRGGLKGLVLKAQGSHYPGVAAAIESLDWLAAHSCVVLGFDGLDTDGRHIRPRLDRIADLSAIEGSRADRVR